MRELRAWTPEEIAELQERIRNAPPGSAFDRAKKYGIDLSLDVEQLKLSPAERVRRMMMASEAVEQLRGLARNKR